MRARLRDALASPSATFRCNVPGLDGIAPAVTISERIVRE
jgi:hypothetical protein